MFEIQGEYGRATCFATSIEDEAVSQIRDMLQMPFTEGQNIAIMPDAHMGKGCTIGTTMTVTDAVCPNLVGVDINCGLYVVDLGCDHVDLPKLDEACHIVPSGQNVWDAPRTRFDLSQLTCAKHLKHIDRIQRSIGTLGSGNHFSELERSETGNLYLTIHSGSRNLGLQVANFHQSIAISLHNGDADYDKRRTALIEQYKREGRARDIQAALQELQETRKDSGIPEELAWLYGQWMDDYLQDVAVCQQFAKLNRETIADAICAHLGIEPVSAFHTIHNYIDIDEMILRKGAISAKKDELVIIPLNMRDGSVIARGKGNPDWNQSGPHGAGRLMSRNAARKALSLDDFAQQMEGVYTTSVCEATLDEAPGAYKSKDDILGPISEAVDIIEVMKPVYNFKAH